MKRLSLFMFIVVIAALIPAAPSVAQGGDAIPQPDETLPGFKANGVYEASGIENLSLYNGDPQLAVPLGPAYPTGPGSSFQLTAYYSTRFWHMYQVPCQVDAYCGVQTVGRAHVRGQSTLGVGWTLELGSVSPSQEPEGYAWYLSPDGGKHEFPQPSLSSPPFFIAEGAEVQVKRLSPDGYVVRRTDGTSLWLTHRYTRPIPRNGVDFSDVDRYAGVNPPDPRSERWGLQRMEDSFGRTVLEVSWQADYPSADAWKVASIQLHDPDRVIQFSWTRYQETWDVLSSISFPILAPSGGSTYPAETLTAQFGYAPSGLFERTSFDTGWESDCQELSPRFVDLPFLATISQATNTHQFEYSLEATLDDPETETSTGVLTAYRLPTGTRVEYEYPGPEAMAMPSCIRGISCSSLDETIPPSTPEPQSPDPDCDFWAKAMAPFIDTSPAVVSRTETDPVTGRSSTTEYARAQFSERDPDFPYEKRRDPKRTLRRVIAKRPTGNGVDVAATRHLFHVFADGPGLEVERRHYYGPLAAGEAGAVARSIVQCHRAVSPVSSDTACAAFAADGTISSFNKEIPGDARVSRVVTWYGANPVGADALGGEVCSDTSARTVACKVEDWTGWVPAAREFAQEAITAPKTGPSAVFLAGTQLGRRTTTAWTPKSGTSYWQPKLFSSRTVEDFYSNGCPFPPCSITTSTTFDDETGALESSTVSISQYSNRKVEFEYTGGNPTAETISGAGLTGTYRTERAFQSGLVTTSRRILGANDPVWNQYHVIRDAALGLVTVSRDPNGLETSYSWDSQARLRRIRPPGEHATTICYTPWNSGNPTRGALSLVRRGAIEGCSTTGVVPAAGSETLEAYLYDGSGRLSREIRLLPNTLTGDGTMNYLAVRTTERNAIGLVTAVSEWEPCGSGTDVSTCFTTNTTKKTWFSNFDVFGRARSILLPDDTQVVKGYDDWEIATYGTHIPATDTRVGTWTHKADSTSAYEAVRKDILGRTIAIAAPVTSVQPPASEPQPTLGELTFYYNDIHDQVAKVTQERVAADRSYYTQVRTFTRNAFGFLTSEVQPETGTTSYSSFTALGHPKTVINGDVRRDRTYDPLGRLLTEKAGGKVYVTNTWDEATDANGVSRGWSTGKLTTSIGENPFPSEDFDNLFFPGGTITDSYRYDGRGGRLSRKESTLSNGAASAVTSWTYNAFGLVELEEYPRLPHLAGQLVAETRYAAGAPIRITVGGQDVAKDIKYDPAGHLAGYTSGSNVKTTILADPNGMPRPRQIKSSHPDFDTGEYGYDGFGNILSMGADKFTYDASSRLLSAKYYGETLQAYAYDGWNNLISRAGTLLPINKATNRLTGATYDPRGNLKFFLGETYSYDGLNRQARHDANGSNHSYLFDASNERIVKALPPSKDKSPQAALKRREMARVILQVLGERPRSAYAGVFADVPSDDPEAGWIERFYDLRFTNGCAVAPQRYCPDSLLSRSEMAVFLSSALAGGRGAVPPSGTKPGVGDYDCRSGGSSLFVDVAPDHWACSNIHYIFVHDVTKGCGENPRIYCPDETVTNFEMEIFVSRMKPGFGYVPPGATYTFRGSEGRLLTEYADSTLAKDYVYLGNRLVGTLDAGGWKYHSTDHLGSVRLTTNAMGEKVDAQKYWPWGEHVGTGSVSRLGFAGMELDAEASLPRYYDHARSLETGIGRFLSADPLSGRPEDPLSWNRYVYARNNPLKYVDPDGRAIETAWDVASFVVGAGSFIRNVGAGSYGAAALDLGGMVVDGLAVATPFVPGGAGAGIRAARLAAKADDVIDAGRAGAVALDTNAIIARLEGAPKDVQAVVKAMGDRQTNVSITAVKEFLKGGGDVTALRSFLQSTGGSVGKAPSKELLEKLTGLGLKPADARVVGSAMEQGIPVLTRDKQILKKVPGAAERF